MSRKLMMNNAEKLEISPFTIVKGGYDNFGKWYGSWSNYSEENFVELKNEMVGKKMYLQCFDGSEILGEVVIEKIMYFDADKNFIKLTRPNTISNIGVYLKWTALGTQVRQYTDDISKMRIILKD